MDVASYPFFISPIYIAVKGSYIMNIFDFWDSKPSKEVKRAVEHCKVFYLKKILEMDLATVSV